MERNGIRKGIIGALLIAMGLILTPLKAAAIDLPDEDLNYVILYKWGLINKDAASAVLSLRSDSGHYYAQLAARTLPWADKILMVRDTLKSTMLRDGCVPEVYTKITHEGERYRRDVVRYERDGNRVTGYAERWRSKNGGPLTHTDTILHATGRTVDMLSVFYYLRTLDFANMQPGQTVKLNVFSGKSVEQLSVRYDGIETITVNKNKWRTYHLSFSFTQDGKVSSDAMETWISSDASRVPIQLEGQLALGKVRAYFTGKPGTD